MRRLARSALLALSLLALTSCAADPPPEGFEIRLRFVSVDPAVLESVRVTIAPEGADRFLMVEPMSYEGGAIELEVATDGVLVLTLDGAHVAARAEAQGDGSFIYPLEVWTSDQQVRAPAPGVRVIGNRAGSPIAEGFLYLPEWPPPLGGNTLIPVNCLDPGAGLCRP